MKKLTALLAILGLIGLQVAFAQTRSIKGTVTSKEDGMGLPGVNVSVKGTATGTATDGNGNFTLSVAQNAQTLVISSIGYQSVEMPVQDVVNVVLEPETKQIDEVMVVAYGTSKKSSFTGSAEVIKKEKLEKIQSASVTKALEGSAPGVQVTGGNGQPGAGASVRIRGISSINSSNAPLYVVDGMPFDGDVNSINTEDMESITVLKDASSSALYGARGANGVIMITTKKGKTGDSKINFKSTYSLVDRSIPEYDRVDEADYIGLMYEGWRNALIFKSGQAFNVASNNAAGLGNPANGIIAKLGNYNPFSVANNNLIQWSTTDANPANANFANSSYKLNPNAKLLWNEDWQKELFHVGKRTENQLNISGGNEKTDYYFSFGYLNEEGLAKNTNFDRFTARINANSQVKSWLKVGLNMSAGLTKTDNFLAEGTYTTNPFYYTRMMGPIYPIHKYNRIDNGDGTFSAEVAIDPSTGEAAYDFGLAPTKRPYAGNSNLASTLKRDKRGFSRDDFSGKTYAEIKFLKDFTFRINAGGDISQTAGTTYQNFLYGDAANVSGRSTKNNTRNFTTTINQQLNYVKVMGDHSIDVMVGHESYDFISKYLTATRIGFGLPSDELSFGATGEASSSQTDRYKIEGYLSRFNYDYKDKYYFSASFRRDGSSRFYKDSRWGNFWSLGGSWRISEEDFMKEYTFINTMKLKASYGEQGNDGISTYYGWQELYTIDDYNNNNSNGAWLSSLGNKDLQWEVNKNFNVGIEFKIFNRLTGEVNYFTKKSDNLLMDVPLPQSTGIGARTQNVGSLENKGFELQANIGILRDTDLKWDFDFNITTFKNEITKLPQKEIINGTKKYMVGKSVYDFWLRDYAGVDPANGDALYFYDEVDVNGVPTGNKLTTNDRNKAGFYYVGSAIPDFFGGFSNNFSYKGVELSIFFTYSIGGKMYDNAYAALMHPGTFGTAWHTDIKDRWQKPGDITDVPRLQNGNTNITAQSSRFLFDASYLLLKNITLSYNIPANYTKVVGVDNLKVFVSGDNLKLFNKNKGMDPQQSFTGVSDYTYVPNKTITFGLNLQF